MVTVGDSLLGFWRRNLEDARANEAGTANANSRWLRSGGRDEEPGPRGLELGARGDEEIVWGRLANASGSLQTGNGAAARPRTGARGRLNPTLYFKATVFRW